MKGTIEFTSIDRPTPGEKLALTKIVVEGKGTELEFLRGLDTRTRRPYRYQVTLTPGIGAGSWEHHEDNGLIERVAVQEGHRQPGEGLGVASLVYTGIWVEGGQRVQMRAEITTDA